MVSEVRRIYFGHLAALTLNRFFGDCGCPSRDDHGVKGGSREQKVADVTRDLQISVLLAHPR